MVLVVLKKTNADAVDFKGFLCTAETAGQQRQGYFTSESNLAKTACLSKVGVGYSIPQNNNICHAFVFIIKLESYSSL